MAAESPMQVSGATTVSVAQAQALFDKEAAFVDVRKDSAWDAGCEPGAIHLNFKSVLSAGSLANEIGKDEAVVIYCNGASCMRSSESCAKAVGWGFCKVHYFRDGFPAWKAAGNPEE